MAKAATRTMTAQHKAALAEGRSEGRAVKNYLEALQQNRPKRGRRRTSDSIKKRLTAIDTMFGDSDHHLARFASIVEAKAEAIPLPPKSRWKQLV